MCVQRTHHTLPHSETVKSITRMELDEERRLCQYAFLFLFVPCAGHLEQLFSLAGLDSDFIREKQQLNCFQQSG